MPFCSYDDIVPAMISEQEMIELTDDRQLGVVDQAIFEQKRDAADALILGYTSGKYPDGFGATNPAILRELSKDMTIYRIRKRRPNTVSEQMDRDEAARIKLLESIQKGYINLGVSVATPTDTTTSGTYRTNKTASDRLFPKSKLDLW